MLNLFYIPGTVLGAFVSDWIGPRYTLALGKHCIPSLSETHLHCHLCGCSITDTQSSPGVTLQAIVGFIMAGAYEKLAQPQYIGAFAVVYGIFLSLGELGPGNK